MLTLRNPLETAPTDNGVRAAGAVARRRASTAAVVDVRRTHQAALRAAAHRRRRLPRSIYTVEDHPCREANRGDRVD